MNSGPRLGVEPRAVGRRIARIRTGINLSVQDAARRAEVSEDFFSQLERGEIDPIEFYVLEAVSRALSSTMHSLVCEDPIAEQPANRTVLDNANEALIRRLPAELRELLAADEASGSPPLPEPVLAALANITFDAKHPTTASEWKPIVRGFMRAIGRDYSG
jgi:transcriptional regulator with XRE-family HTH domain